MLGRLAGVHSPSAHVSNDCWCQRAGRPLLARPLERAPRPWQLCFREYDLPEGRTWESFRYLVEDIYGAGPVDELVTDDPAERDRLVAAGLEQGYDQRVTDRQTGEVTYTQWQPSA